jgi:hypothetical protein
VRKNLARKVLTSPPDECRQRDKDENNSRPGSSLLRNPVNVEAQFMTGRFFPDKQINNARVRRPISARVFVWLTVIAVAGAIVAAGFVISARQHFKAVSIGYQSTEIRRQVTQLEEERDRLQSQMDSISSDIDIEKLALDKGFKRPSSGLRKIRRPTSK